ncbi:hypothetical protein K4K61_011327 [Colletotrichum sp. SAR11_59]|nr:hypothetical protein K4K61_011327 [Colletotrichum sp. SAR11_59]
MTGYEDSNMVEAQARTPYASVAPDEMTADQFDEKDQQAVEVEEEIPLRDDNPVVGESLRLPTVPSRPLPFWIRYPKALLWCFVPSFLHPTDPTKPPKQLHPTAWLDGLRGIASFVVVCHHWSLVVYPIELHKGYLSDDKPMFIQLPIIRLAVSGYWAVCVFFVISGFALSYKPMKLLSQNRRADFAIAAASSAFRRYIRIFASPAVTTLVIALMTYAGWFQHGARPKTLIFPRLRPPVAGTLYGQLEHWFVKIVGFADPVSRNTRRGNNFPYDAALWTIPIEFDCSMVIFLAHVAFSRLRPGVRLFLHVFVSCYTLWFNMWEFFLFFAGLLLADLHFHFQPASGEFHEGEGGWNALPRWTNSLRRDSFARFQSMIAGSPTFSNFRSSIQSRRDSLSSSPSLPKFKKVIGISAFIFSLWLLSYPHLVNDAAATPGYRALTAITPKQYKSGDSLWIPLGAILLIFTIDRVPSLQRMFNRLLIQYLGRISFMLYLVHNSMLWMYGWHTWQFMTSITGVATSWQYFWSVFWASCFFLPVVIVVADFFQRYVDSNAVAFAAWLEKKLIDKTA